MRRLSAIPVAAALIALLAGTALASGPTAGDGQRQAGSGGSAKAAGPVSTSASRYFWATVNACDTPTSPNKMGVRASMPGNGTGQRMYMRFSAEHWSEAEQEWLPVGGAISPWIYAGSARYRYRQAGWTFEFEQPSGGKVHTLRGVVEVQWRSRKPRSRRARRARRARWVIARRRSLITRSGVESVDRGDPPGTSKAMCLLS